MCVPTRARFPSSFSPFSLFLSLFFFIYIFVPFFYFLFGTLDVFPILLVDSAPIANTFVGAEKCN